jgi:thiamine kinase-like enzyme
MIPEVLLNLRVLSRGQLVAAIRVALGEEIERVIDTHNTASIIFIYRHQNNPLLLKAEFGAVTATHKEIEWYRTVKDMSVDNIDLLDSYSAGNYALMLIEYIEGSATLDDMAYGDEINSETIVSAIRQAMQFDRMLFEKTASVSSMDQVDLFYRRKYEQRRIESEKVPFLAELFSRPSVVINGKNYDTPDIVMQKLESNLSINKLTPKRMGLIHGDLHCGNVLAKGKSIFLIDPNGSPVMPIEYDMGKLLHSIHGHYGSIMRGDYNLEERNAFHFSFSVNAPDVYISALADIKQNMPREEYMRALYSEAMHFVTMLPHHARERRETTALFLRSVQLFDELVTAIKVDTEYGLLHNTVEL